MSDRITTKELYDAIHNVDKKLSVNNEHTKGIEEHLKQLNSKVAKNIEKIAKNRDTIGTVEKDVHDLKESDTERKGNIKYWHRKLLWWGFLGFAGLASAVLTATGLINF